MDTDDSADPARECRQALDLALARLRSRGDDPAAYRVTAVSASPARGPGAWRVVLRPRGRDAGAPGAEVTAGGEVFVDVDLGTGEAVFRAGE